MTPGVLGWATPGGGRAANVTAGSRYAGTTSQLCGLFPFAVASGATLTGVPLGRSLHTAEPVGLDPAHWLRTGLISNTGVWVQGQPGIGKSSITKRLVTGLVGFGMRALIPGDIKGEYTPLVQALGGTVWRLGRGRHTLNPLDPALAAPALAAAVGTTRHQLTETLRARTLALLEALLVIAGSRQLSATRRRLLAAALDQTAAARSEPTIPDLLDALTHGAEPLARIVAAPDDCAYTRSVRGLVNTLGLLCDGSLRGLFDRPSTITADPTAPALSLDLSALDGDADDVVAAAMLCSWAWSATLADTAGDHRNPCRFRTSCGGPCAPPPAWSNTPTGSPASDGTAASCPSRSPTASTTSTPSRRTSTGPRPGAWPPATPSSSWVAWPPRTSTACAGSSPCPSPNASWSPPGPRRRPGIPGTPTPAAAAT